MPERVRDLSGDLPEGGVHGAQTKTSAHASCTDMTHDMKDTPPRSGTRIPNGLLALGSAAVLAVYSAGNLQTMEAARQFDDHGGGRRRPMPPSIASAGDDRALPPVAIAASAASSPDTGAPAAAGEAEATSQPIATQPVATESKPSTSETATSETARSDTSAPVSPTPIKAEPIAADSAEAKTAWRDGAYTGYGTSRHGDIEATVVIEGGRITSATISRCLTRYSCSWISHLQAQVVARQSPNVDYVSGATESANAFFYAVFEALLKAE
jgi:uncharacterized protein with FMN-binding domain